MPSAEQIRENNLSSPILLLRRFRDDNMIFKAGFSFKRFFFWGGYRTFEEFIEGIVSRSEPFIALGRPGEKTPPDGAARDYLGADWEDRIIEYINEAQTILVLVSDSRGVNWEMSRIKELEFTDKTIFVFPPAKRRKRLARWNSFTSSIFQHRLDNIRTRSGANRSLAICQASYGRLFIFSSHGKNGWPYLTAVWMA